MNEKVLLQYQKEWLRDTSPIRLWEKSRRIGASWIVACESVLTSGAISGMDSWYIGYNEAMTREFVQDCKFWAKHFQLAAKEMDEVLVEEKNKSYLILEIKFLSGWKIKALSSRPENLRGKQGKVVIDEAAFHDNLSGLLKAAIALIIWGGRVDVLSTHNGKENHFNKLLEEVKAGKKNYSLHRTTIDDALDQGLYKQICLVLKKEWTEEKENNWRQDLIDQYGFDANEELFCVPLTAGKGLFFKREQFIILKQLPDDVQWFRAWDKAATFPSKANPDPDYTVGVKMGYSKKLEIWIVADVIRGQWDVNTVQSKIKFAAVNDGKRCTICLFVDPGQAGKFESSSTVKELVGYNVVTLHTSSTHGKINMAKPFASQVQAGNVAVLQADWNDSYFSTLEQFPEGKHDDDVDASSLVFRFCSQKSVIVAPVYGAKNSIAERMVG